MPHWYTSVIHGIILQKDQFECVSGSMSDNILQKCQFNLEKTAYPLNIAHLS